jgi:hypothetical protein
MPNLVYCRYSVRIVGWHAVAHCGAVAGVDVFEIICSLKSPIVMRSGSENTLHRHLRS